MLTMTPRRLLVLLISICCATTFGCSGPKENPGAAKEAGASDEKVAAASASNASGSMDDAIAKLMAQGEQPDEGITVQHVLIAFQGAPRIRDVTRTKEEAKQLAEQVWREAVGGADFKTLMKTHSNDSGGGEYPMTKAGRRQMVAAFGNVGFRLKVGEIGVAPWHVSDSPYGWHIIKRIK
jgi:parvulin-like peptidyl-prolyl isomerase